MPCRRCLGTPSQKSQQAEPGPLRALVLMLSCLRAGTTVVGGAWGAGGPVGRSGPSEGGVGLGGGRGAVGWSRGAEIVGSPPASAPVRPPGHCLHPWSQSPPSSMNSRGRAEGSRGLKAWDTALGGREPCGWGSGEGMMRTARWGRPSGFCCSVIIPLEGCRRPRGGDPLRCSCRRISRALNPSCLELPVHLWVCKELGLLAPQSRGTGPFFSAHSVVAAGSSLMRMFGVDRG